MGTSTLRENADPLANSQAAQVAVVGGGPAGLATAIALARLQIGCIAIEASDYTQPRLGEHLTPEGVMVLQQFGLWNDEFAGKHRFCYGIRSAWGEDRIAQSDYIFHPSGHGVNLSRPAFDCDLAALARREGVDILLSSQLKTVRREGEEWVLSLNAPTGYRTVRAAFVVDASGRNAVVARSQGQKSHYRDRLVGVAAFLQPRNPSSGGNGETLLLEACQWGWWYFARLQDGRGVFLHVTDGDLLAPGKEGSLGAWRDRLESTRYFKDVANSYEPAETVIVRSARSHCLERVTGEQWLAVGDAAMSFDPLSSMGITKGLKSGIVASQIVLRYFQGDTSALETYNHDIQQKFGSYLEERAAYYQMERRWPSSPFWQRRHS